MKKNLAVKKTLHQGAAESDAVVTSISSNRSGVRLNKSFHYIDLKGQLPFLGDDTTAGVENELQAVVIGEKENVDLPIFIKKSNYFKNIIAEAKTGNSPKQAISALEAFIDGNRNGVWENSWVRFPRERMSVYANEVFERDLLADKSNVFGHQRTDHQQFLCKQNGLDFIRVPISYLLKLALADVISFREVDDTLVSIGNRLMSHFLSDNTSPEVFSFSPMKISPDEGLGQGIIDETLIRFALCQFLTQHANSHLGLREHGQKALVYFAPNPPLRQKQLNELITDTFYREIFMSPCLSGWDKGEEKKEYMALCHRVLSLSQLNAVYKLKEAGILTRNLVVMPTTSNISLANNGTHISLGSRILTDLSKDPQSGFGETQEKYFGDLVIKIAEHFLPLFVGTYSAAPYRLDFQDFHPERVLGFLPHELESTHLKMIWRRWKKKADLRFMGQSLTPFGPVWLDRSFSKLLGLKGDYVPDFRLLDYFVSVLSTEQSPALNGKVGNDIQLKNDLASLGVFDNSMSVYLLCRIREFAKMGFSGFENRYYSQFKEISTDMKHAVHLQLIIIALAYRFVLEDRVTHADIPDETFIESERRQIFFSTAIGLPTFFVRKNTRNRFLEDILKDVRKTRSSRRYEGFVRVHVREYIAALVRKLKRDGESYIREMGMQQTIADLEQRVEKPDAYSTAGRLSKAILETAGTTSAMKLKGNDYNAAAEEYYRNGLRKENMREAMKALESHAAELDSLESWRSGEYNTALMSVLKGKNAKEFVKAVTDDVINEKLPHKNLVQLILLTLLIIDRNRQTSGQPNNKTK